MGDTMWTLGYSNEAGHTMALREFSDAGALWDALKSYGAELTAEVNAAISTGYSLQTHTFTAPTEMDGRMINQTLTVIDLDTHAADGSERVAYGRLTEYYGTDLERGMSLRLDGHDWNIDHVFPMREVNVDAIDRDGTRNILQLSTFVRHEGQVQRAYVIDNADTFQVIA